MVPFWVPTIIRHLLFRLPKKRHNFDNHPDKELLLMMALVIEDVGSSDRCGCSAKRVLALLSIRSWFFWVLLRGLI